MPQKLLLSTAYLPPVEYFSLISHSVEVFIEREENYLKQSYRNRSIILSTHGPQSLSVPVYLGSQHKTKVKDIKIDYSKRWQKVHLGAIIASYNASPYFQYYFDDIEKIISRKNEYLIELNMNLTETLLNMLKLRINLALTSLFEPVADAQHDFRYSISPKIESKYQGKEYLQVFNNENGFVNNLSIIDLIFNTGPDSGLYF
jgi:hypothetical protein